jgi:transposase
MRPYGSPKTLERRRRRAIDLLAQGLSLREVARQVQASAGSVYQWRQVWQHGGEAALAPKPAPGRPRKLTDVQCAELLQLLLQGAKAHGFPNELWTLKRSAAVIRVQFGVDDHPAQVWKILRRLGWSCQGPARRALQRDEQAIADWQRNQWPAIKKSPPPGRSPRLSGGQRLSAHADAPPHLGAGGAHADHPRPRHT